MHAGRTVFSQLIDFLPKREFDKCVRRYRAFAQITYRQSLRDIETCLRAMQSKLYHCGIRSNVSRTTLAKAKENRDWRIYAEFAHVLIQKAQELYANEEFGVQLKHATYVLDSTTIDLCLSLFPWARFRKHKAQAKSSRDQNSIPPQILNPTWFTGPKKTNIVDTSARGINNQSSLIN